VCAGASGCGIHVRYPIDKLISTQCSAYILLWYIQWKQTLFCFCFCFCFFLCFFLSLSLFSLLSCFLTVFLCSNLISDVDSSCDLDRPPIHSVSRRITLTYYTGQQWQGWYTNVRDARGKSDAAEANLPRRLTEEARAEHSVFYPRIIRAGEKRQDPYIALAQKNVIAVIPLSSLLFNCQCLK